MPVAIMLQSSAVSKTYCSGVKLYVGFLYHLHEMKACDFAQAVFLYPAEQCPVIGMPY